MNDPQVQTRDGRLGDGRRSRDLVGRDPELIRILGFPGLPPPVPVIASAG